MATDALRSQVASKWQESFNRLNQNAPGISGLMNFSEAWSISTQFLYPRNIRLPLMEEQPDLRVAQHAFTVISQCRRLPVLLENFLDDVKQNFVLIEKEIGDHMARHQEQESPEIVEHLVECLIEWYKAWSPPSDLGLVVFQSYTLTFQTQLFSALPSGFGYAFKQLCASLLAPSEGTSDNKTTSKSWMVNSKSEIWKNFELLGLIDRYENVLASVGYEFIEEHVLATCKGRWEKPMLEELRTWMSENVVPWMLHVYARDASSPEEARAMLQGVGSRFDFHINKTLCDLRTQEIFDIIIDFPDSMGALQDLRECMQRVDQRSNLVAVLRKANRKRLLHPGADTKLILQQYVATIKCLRMIDPPGVLLFKVAEPIRRYLRDRPDTIRSIVSNLVGDEDSGDSLVDENEPIQPLQQQEVEDYSDPNWEPEPIDAGPEFRTNKPSDIISTLVSIYDSRDLFIKELQVLLAQRLLSMKDGSDRVEKERKNVEILKIRFGEVALQVCEVMLKDMTDSKRVDAHVQAQKDFTLHPTIISRHFWPSLDSSALVMPGQFKTLQEEYAREFTKFKPDKKLQWLPHLGTVQLDVELEDRTVSAEVPPLEAALIELFSERAVWELDDLIAAVGSLNRGVIIKALGTWVDLGVLKEDPENTFVLLEHEEQGGVVRGHARGVTDDPEPIMSTSMQQQQAEQMRVFWKFIEGMLTNLGSLPIDRIQTMLKFAPGYDQTVEQLAAFMEAARREGLVCVRDGMWRLNK